MKPIWDSTSYVDRLVGHRGEMQHYPENSLLAVRATLEGGARWVEVDVQLNQNGEPYLLHDANVNRTTADDVCIFSLSSERLKSVSIHEPRRFGKVFYPTPIPHLKALLPLLDEFPRARLLVEIKRHSIQYFGVEKVVEVLEEVLQPYQDRCYVISYHDAILAQMQQKGFAIGWILATHDEASCALVKRLRPELIICNHSKITNLAEQLWQGKNLAGEPWRWMLYEVNKLNRVNSLMHLGVDLVETANTVDLVKELKG